MPIFEYECSDCKKKFEELVSGPATKPECPSCRSTNTKKLLSVFAAQVGSGKTEAPSCARGDFGGGGCCGGFGCGN